MKNHYIVIEGLEGAGKTSAINTVIDTLAEVGVHNITLPASQEAHR